MSTVSSAVGVENVPQAIRSPVTLADPDYVDVFTITTPDASGRTPEEWARAILEEAPVSRRFPRILWRLLGLRLGPPGSPDYVQGWKIAGRGDDWIRVETGSWYASAQAVCLVGNETVSVSLSLRYDRPIARLIWAPVSVLHQRGVPVMLKQAARLGPIQSPRG